MKKLPILSLLVISSFAYPNCTMCHNGDYQKELNQFTKKEIIQKLQNFKESKENDTMVSIAKQMDDNDIKEVANKYGK